MHPTKRSWTECYSEETILAASKTFGLLLPEVNTVPDLVDWFMLYPTRTLHENVVMVAQGGNGECAVQTACFVEPGSPCDVHSRMAPGIAIAHQPCGEAEGCWPSTGFKVKVLFNSEI